jgi:hypothetical protein
MKNMKIFVLAAVMIGFAGLGYCAYPDMDIDDFIAGELKGEQHFRPFIREAVEEYNRSNTIEDTLGKLRDVSDITKRELSDTFACVLGGQQPNGWVQPSVVEKARPIIDAAMLEDDSKFNELLSNPLIEAFQGAGGNPQFGFEVNFALKHFGLTGSVRKALEKARPWYKEKRINAVKKIQEMFRKRTFRKRLTDSIENRKKEKSAAIIQKNFRKCLPQIRVKRKAEKKQRQMRGGCASAAFFAATVAALIYAKKKGIIAKLKRDGFEKTIETHQDFAALLVLSLAGCIGSGAYALTA